MKYDELQSGVRGMYSAKYLNLGPRSRSLHVIVFHCIREKNIKLIKRQDKEQDRCS